MGHDARLPVQRPCVQPEPGSSAEPRGPLDPRVREDDKRLCAASLTETAPEFTLHVWEHREGVIDGFTKRYALKRLVHYEFYDDIRSAIQREKT